MNTEQFTYLSIEFSLLPDQQIDQIALEQSLFDILLYLSKEQKNNVLVSYHHVGKTFNISKVTTKKRLDELKNKGLITIKEKGRMKVIKLTVKGETLLNRRDII